jgi:hypothetical protein
MPNSPIAAGDLFSPNTRPWIGGCTFATSLRESTFAGEIMPKTSVWASKPLRVLQRSATLPAPCAPGERNRQIRRADAVAGYPDLKAQSHKALAAKSICLPR